MHADVGTRACPLTPGRRHSLPFSDEHCGHPKNKTMSTESALVQYLALLDSHGATVVHQLAGPASDEDVLAVDGVHPTAAGAQRLTEIYTDAVHQLC